MPKRTVYEIYDPDPKIVVENISIGGILTNRTKLVIEGSDASDSHYTFNELYNHRFALFAALCKIYDKYLTPLGSRVTCWKSEKHHDGSMFPNWFIAGMTIQKADMSIQHITYHLPIIWWNNFDLMVLESAPEWDGHTSDDVIKRLLEL